MLGVWKIFQGRCIGIKSNIYVNPYGFYYRLHLLMKNRKTVYDLP